MWIFWVRKCWKHQHYMTGSWQIISDIFFILLMRVSGRIVVFCCLKVVEHRNLVGVAGLEERTAISLALQPIPHAGWGTPQTEGGSLARTQTISGGVAVSGLRYAGRSWRIPNVFHSGPMRYRDALHNLSKGRPSLGNKCMWKKTSWSQALCIAHCNSIGAHQ